MKPVLRYQSQLLYRRSYKPKRVVQIKPAPKQNFVFRSRPATPLRHCVVMNTEPLPRTMRSAASWIEIKSAMALRTAAPLPSNLNPCNKKDLNALSTLSTRSLG